ncbi:unnamed protein product [Nippostrongylus brasiliensis]|uniref:Secreted protein n=1 Tax=Nippostrongylus brasiliensis TaxID=27835 RepID=A0A0N4Y5V0_NIPBR|nr:unnamed protein product [Nippostrongylus brasiliensis]
MVVFGAGVCFFGSGSSLVTAGTALAGGGLGGRSSLANNSASVLFGGIADVDVSEVPPATCDSSIVVTAPHELAT